MVLDRPERLHRGPGGLSPAANDRAAVDGRARRGSPPAAHARRGDGLVAQAVVRKRSIIAFT